MKNRVTQLLAIASLGGFLLLSQSAVMTSAHADQPATTAQSTAASTAPHDENTEVGEHGRPRHSVDESHEGGFETIQIIVVGVAVVIAVALAYRAGRHRNA